MSKIAVLIPCYNESKTIAQVVNDYKTALPEADIYCMTTTLKMVQMKWHAKRERS